MTTRALLVAAGIFTASLSPALAESVTAIVSDWDPANRTITLDDMSKFSNIPNTVTVPDIQPGNEVTIEYQAGEDGVTAYNSVTVNRDVAKRLVPGNKRG